LIQLAMFTNAIHNKDSVEALGKDYGIKAIDGTGPWCFDHWQPRTEIVLKRHEAYKWGPSMYKNKGPVKFEKLVIKIVPEDSSRVAAMMSGQFDITHQFPSQFITQAKAAPMLTVTAAKPNFQLLYFGFKITRPMVSDRRVREAMSIAINRAEIAGAILLGNAEPALTIVHPDALDHDPATKGVVKEDIERAKALLEEAGWKVGADGIREKDGVKLQPKVYYTANANSARCAEAIQGYLRKIGVDWRLNPWDSTISPVKMAEQDYELWSVTVPYLSAGDLMNIYFDSANIPTPNRMNWKDAETDAWLKQGRSALNPADRTKFYALVQQKAMREHLWMPVLNINMDQVANKKISGARPHMIYQNTFYKGLDVTR
jgi:peptide/nickel transport system substrate-binding protein